MHLSLEHLISEISKNIEKLFSSQIHQYLEEQYLTNVNQPNATFLLVLNQVWLTLDVNFMVVRTPPPFGLWVPHLLPLDSHPLVD